MSNASVTLDEESWADVYYAVELKLSRVKNGAYHEGDQDHEEWICDLEDTLESIALQLDEQGVNY